MKKWDVTMTCNVIVTYTIEAESEEVAEHIATEVFIVKVDEPYNRPEILSIQDDYEDNVEEVRAWTAS